MADVDGDGDQDVVFANGDMFDSLLLKPYHGIQWLENTGVFPFRRHRLAALPGVHRALAGDLDLDGDVDIVAAAFVPQVIRESEAGRNLESLIWLEQTSAGRFVRHSIEVGNCTHACLDLADFDGDGDLDIATGSIRENRSPDDSPVTVWWNERAGR